MRVFRVAQVQLEGAGQRLLAKTQDVAPRAG